MSAFGRVPVVAREGLSEAAVQRDASLLLPPTKIRGHSQAISRRSWCSWAQVEKIIPSSILRATSKSPGCSNPDHRCRQMLVEQDGRGSLMI